MAQSRLGQWQPHRHDDKRWLVTYTITLDGVVHDQTRKFRTRDNARHWVKRSTAIVQRDERVSHYRFDITNIHSNF